MTRTLTRCPSRRDRASRAFPADRHRPIRSRRFIPDVADFTLRHDCPLSIDIPVALRGAPVVLARIDAGVLLVHNAIGHRAAALALGAGLDRRARYQTGSGLVVIRGGGLG